MKTNASAERVSAERFQTVRQTESSQRGTAFKGVRADRDDAFRQHDVFKGGAALEAAVGNVLDSFGKDNGLQAPAVGKGAVAERLDAGQGDGLKAGAACKGHFPDFCNAFRQIGRGDVRSAVKGLRGDSALLRGECQRSG